jgi:hypothetical protein
MIHCLRSLYHSIGYSVTSLCAIPMVSFPRPSALYIVYIVSNENRNQVQDLIQSREGDVGRRGGNFYVIQVFDVFRIHIVIE